MQYEPDASLRSSQAKRASKDIWDAIAHGLRNEMVRRISGGKRVKYFPPSSLSLLLLIVSQAEMSGKTSLKEETG
jgi:hypothetical protein